METLANLLWGLIFIGFGVLVITGILRVLFSPVWRGQRKSAEDILKERYAKGEISAEEYRRKLHEIRS